MVEVLDIGDRVETGSYRLHSRFHAALAFLHCASGSLACVVDESKVSGPIHIRVRGVDLTAVESLAVTDRTVCVDGVSVDPGQRYDSQVRPIPIGPKRLRRNLQVLCAVLRDDAPARSLAFLVRKPAATAGFKGELERRFLTGVERLVSGDLAGVDAIRGLGPGLTPGGDDFLAGYLLGLYALGESDVRREVAARAASGNPFSAAMLRCAAEGRSIEPARSLIEAMFDGGQADSMPYHAHRLLAVGASSGADMATGIYFSLHSRVA